MTDLALVGTLQTYIHVLILKSSSLILLRKPKLPLATWLIWLWPQNFRLLEKLSFVLESNWRKPAKSKRFRLRFHLWIFILECNSQSVSSIDHESNIAKLSGYITKTLIKRSHYITIDNLVLIYNKRWGQLYQIKEKVKDSWWKGWLITWELIMHFFLGFPSPFRFRTWLI